MARYLASKTYVEPEELYQVPRLPRPEGESARTTPARSRRLIRLVSSSNPLSRSQGTSTPRTGLEKPRQIQSGSPVNLPLSSPSQALNTSSSSKSGLPAPGGNNAHVSAASHKYLNRLREGHGLSDMQWDGLIKRCDHCQQYFLGEVLDAHLRRCLGQIVL